jgi:alkylated DNA repair protein (DNA oxidative demethylase)
MDTAPDGLLYVPGFLSEEEHATLLRELRVLHYEHDVFRGQRLKRGYAQFGFSYVSTGRKLERVAEMPDFLRVVIEKAQNLFKSREPFNQCIVTHYPPNSGIGWHTDAPRFGECVVGVSLGGEARVQFRPNGSAEVSYEIQAVPGSLYLMHGPARCDHQHQVAPVKAERYSLTFRHVAEE